MSGRKPIRDKVRRLRQRERASGWRVWWEPEAAVRELGFEPVELDPDKPTWSKRRADELNDEVEAARQAGTRPAVKAPRSGERTMRALIHLYRQSRHYLDRKPATQRGYKTNLNVIENKWGDDAVASFTKPVMATWYEALLDQHGISWAKSLMLMTSRLFSFAEDLGWRREGSNPAGKLNLKSAPPRNRWASWQEFQALLQAADDLELPQIAVGAGLLTLNGCRVTDSRLALLDDFKVRKVSDWQGSDVNRLVWSYTSSKRGRNIVQAVNHLIADRVERLIKQATDGQRYLICDPTTGDAYTIERYNTLWRQVRAKAAEQMPSLLDPALQMRDLRRTFGVWARAGGSDKADIGDVLGNSAAVNPLLGETYMPATFYSGMRAIDAITPPKKESKT